MAKLNFNSPNSLEKDFFKPKMDHGKGGSYLPDPENVQKCLENYMVTYPN